MNVIKHYLTGLVLIVGIFFSTGGYATDTSNYRVSYKSQVSPLPLNLIHSWTLHVTTHDGSPVKKAEIAVYGGMPAHRHGLPTQPVVTEMTDGYYLVDGLKFSMMGKWEVWFNINADGVVDKVKFDIEL